MYKQKQIVGYYHSRIQLVEIYDWKYLRTIGDKGPGSGRKGKPIFVKFSPSDAVKIIHEDFLHA